MIVITPSTSCVIYVMNKQVSFRRKEGETACIFELAVVLPFVSDVELHTTNDVSMKEQRITG